MITMMMIMIIIIILNISSFGQTLALWEVTECVQSLFTNFERTKITVVCILYLNLISQILKKYKIKSKALWFASCPLFRVVPDMWLYLPIKKMTPQPQDNSEV